MKKYIILFSICISLMLISCSETIENKPIVENIILNETTWDKIKNVFPNASKEKVYNATEDLYELTEYYYVDYTINNVPGTFSFDLEDDKMVYIYFEPKEHSKASGDSLKNWLFNKYSDYEQITKDTGFIFTNGVENIELYITDHPLDNTKYSNIYIEWTIVE